MTVASGLGDCIDNNTCAEYVNFAAPSAQTLAIAEQYDPNVAASYAAVQAAQAAVKQTVAPRNTIAKTSVSPPTNTVQQQRTSLMRVSSVRPFPVQASNPATSSSGIQSTASSTSGSLNPASIQALAAQLTTDLTTPPSGTGTTSTTPPASTTATTDNPFMDWLGLSSTPVTPLIAGVPNWILLAGGIVLAAFLATEKN